MMKRNNISIYIVLVLSAVVIIFFSACSAANSYLQNIIVLRKLSYPKMYETIHKSVLIMPPLVELEEWEDKKALPLITNVDKILDGNRAKILYSSLSNVLSEKGYYVIPIIMGLESIEIDYNEELDIEKILKMAKEFYDVDMVLFPIIKTMQPYSLNPGVRAQYIIYSTITNDLLFQRDIIFYTNTAYNTFNGYQYAAYQCNEKGLYDLPYGPYDKELHLNDSTLNSTTVNYKTSVIYSVVVM